MSVLNGTASVKYIGADITFVNSDPSLHAITAPAIGYGKGIFDLSEHQSTNLYVQYITADLVSGGNNLVITLYRYASDTASVIGSYNITYPVQKNIAIFGNRLFYVKADGKLYYCDIDVALLASSANPLGTEYLIGDAPTVSHLEQLSLSAPYFDSLVVGYISKFYDTFISSAEQDLNVLYSVRIYRGIGSTVTTVDADGPIKSIFTHEKNTYCSKYSMLTSVYIPIRRRLSFSRPAEYHIYVFDGEKPIRMIYSCEDTTKNLPAYWDLHEMNFLSLDFLSSGSKCLLHKASVSGSSYYDDDYSINLVVSLLPYFASEQDFIYVLTGVRNFTGFKHFIRKNTTTLLYDTIYTRTRYSGKIIVPTPWNMYYDDLGILTPGFQQVANYDALYVSIPETLKFNSSDIFRGSCQNAVVQNPISVAINLVANSPSSAQIVLPSSVDRTYIVPGNRVYITVNAEDQVDGSQSATIGIFMIESVTEELLENGRNIVVNAKDETLGKVEEFIPGITYDYKMHSVSNGLLSNSGKAVRLAGTFKSKDISMFGGTETVECIHQDKNNDDGILYLPFAYTNSFSLDVMFRRIDHGTTNFDLASSRYGLGFGFSSTDDTTVVKKGIFAIYDEVNSEIGIFDYKSDRAGDEWHLLDTIALVSGMESQSKCPMKISYHAGKLTVFTGSVVDDTVSNYVETVTYVEAGSVVIEPYQDIDLNGRLAVYMSEDSPAKTTSYPFMSTDQIVPIKSASGITAPDYVKVESEIIGFSSVKDVTERTGLTILNGRVDPIAQNTSAGTEYSALENDARLVLKQTFTLTAAYTWVRGVSIWLKAVGKIPGNLDISLSRGKVTSTNFFGSKLTSVSIPASSLSTSGSWVYVRFPSAVKLAAGTYYILIGRQDLKTDASNYIKYQRNSTTTSGRMLYLFNDNTDTWASQSASMLFKMYDDAGTLSKYDAPHIFLSSPGAWFADDAMNDAALVVTEGSGVGNLFKVIDTVVSGTNYLLYLNKEAYKLLDETSRLTLCSALHGLTRGVVGDVVAHSEAEANIFRLPQIAVSNFEAATSEGVGLEEIHKKLLASSGVPVEYHRDDYMSSTQYPIGSMPNSGFDLYIDPSVSDPRVLEIRRYVRTPYNNTRTYYFRDFLTFTPTSLKYEKLDEFSNMYYSKEIPCDIGGHVRIIWSIDDMLGFWVNGRLIHSFRIMNPQEHPLCPEIVEYDYGSAEYISTAVSNPSKLTLAVGDGARRFNTSINSQFVDIGKSASQSLQSLIGRRRMYLYGTNLITSFNTFNPSSPIENAYSIGISTYKQETTHVTVEGVRVLEDIDEERAQLYGDRFKLESVPEIFTVDHARNYSGTIIGDNRLRTCGVTVRTPPILGATPLTVYYFKLPDGRIIPVLADTISFLLGITLDQVSFEMTINGRYYEP